MHIKIKKRMEVKEDSISPKRLLESQKILIGIIILNFLLVIYFFVYLPLLFNPYVSIEISPMLLNYKYIGLFIFIFIMGISFLEISRGFRIIMNKEYRTQILMVNTIGQILLRKVLNSPSTEEKMTLYEKEIKALKILIPFMYMNFYLANFYFSLPYSGMTFILEIQFLLSIYIIIYVYHLCIGFIILLKPNKLGSQFLKISSISQLLFYNIMVVLTHLQPWTNGMSNLISDIILFYITIRINVNKDVLKEHISLKYRFCHTCGIKIKRNMKFCPKCAEDLPISKIDLEEVPVKKITKEVSNNNVISEKEEIIAKSSEPVKKPEGLEYGKNLDFVKDEKDKELLEQYLSERFVVVSEQLRKSINKLNLSKKEKIDLLKDLSFLTSKEQQYLLDLLIHLCNE